MGNLCSFSSEQPDAVQRSIEMIKTPTKLQFVSIIGAAFFLLIAAAVTFEGFATINKNPAVSSD